MSDPKDYALNCETGKFIHTGMDAVLTVAPAEIIEVVKKSELSLTEQAVLITIITNLTNNGISNTEKILSIIYEKLIDNTDLFYKFVEILKSIYPSNY